MELMINGQPRTVEGASTVLDVAVQLGLQGKPVVAEADGVILTAAQWALTKVENGMRIEFVHFVGGG